MIVEGGLWMFRMATLQYCVLGQWGALSGCCNQASWWTLGKFKRPSQNQITGVGSVFLFGLKLFLFVHARASPTLAWLM